MHSDHQGSTTTAEPPRRTSAPREASGGRNGKNGKNGRIVIGGDDAKREVLVPGLHPTSHGPVDWSEDQFADAVLGALPDGLLYRFAKSVGEITGSAGCREFIPADPTRFRLIVGPHVRLARWVNHENRVRGERVNFTDDFGRLVFTQAQRGDKPRLLHRLVHYPVYGPDFRPVRPGWHDGTFYDPPPELERLVPEEDPFAIAEVLDELVCDFPFKEEASRHNFFGMLLTPIVRPALDGNVPMHMVKAPLPRTGKSKLIDEVWGGVILGQPMPSETLPEEEEEFKKNLISKLLDGETMVHLDNISRFLDSAVLASLLTSRVVGGRLLGKSQNLKLLNTLTIAASANNPVATGEIVNRIIPIDLHPPRPDPQNRTGFVHDDLVAYVKRVRPRVLGVLLGMVEIWKARGMPSGRVRFGGFEQWARVIGGIMDANGFEHWAGNLEEWRRRADSDGGEMQKFLHAWAEAYGGTWRPASDLLRLAQHYGYFPQHTDGKTFNASVQRFTKRILLKFQDTPHAVDGHSYSIAKRESGNNSEYAIDGAEGEGQGPPVATSETGPPPGYGNLPYGD